MACMHCSSHAPLLNFFFFIQIVIFCTKTTAKIPAIIVFGDSTVDSGNNNYISTIVRSNFEPYGRDFPGGHPTGRFSNGRLAPDFISEAFGLRPTVPPFLNPSFNVADFAVGVCFASAATGYDNATAEVLNVIPMWKQMEYYKEYQRKLRGYLGKLKAEEIITEALYLISIGTNDFLENYFMLPSRQSQYTVSEYEDFLVGLSENFIEHLYHLGARKISLTGLSPMGCLPIQRTLNFQDPFNCMEEYNNVALEFNGKMEVAVRKLNKKLPGMKILFSSPYNMLLQLITEPSKYGFEVTEVGCCGTGTFEMSVLCNRHDRLLTCSDANKYVFWDAIHPTEKTNKIISDGLVKDLKAMFP